MRNIYFSRSDLGACAFYRMEVPHRFLVRSRLAVGTLGLLNDPLLLTNMEDLCVIQRQYSPSIFPLITRKRQMGIRTVGELDDDMWNLSTDNPSYTVYHPADILAREKRDKESGKLPQGQHYLQLKSLLADFYRYVDAITVPTEPLAQVLRQYNKNTYVLPNWLDDSILDQYPSPVGPRKTIRILWTGSISHREELVPPFKAMQKLMAEDSRIVFCYIGAPHPALPEFPQDRLDLYPTTQYVPQYYWLLHKIPTQIAIAPLRDSTFNKSKSAIKALEYGMAGYYPMLQDAPAYDLVKNLGLKDFSHWVPVNTEEAWYRALREAVGDPGECLRRATLFQEGVLSQCRFSQHVQEWLEVYEKIIAAPSNPRPSPRNYGGYNG